MRNYIELILDSLDAVRTPLISTLSTTQDMKLTKFVKQSVLCAASLAATADFVSAETYEFNVEGYTRSSSISAIDDFTVSYTPSNETLTLDVTYANNRPEGFWMVVSDGENSKNNTDGYAIYYFDATAAEPIVTAYVYDGINETRSFETEALLDSSLNPNSNLSGSISQSATGGDVFSLTVDASAINAADFGPDWDGSQFTERVGVRFHTVTFSEAPTYSRAGGLSSFEIDKNNFLDTANSRTGQLPEPSSSMLLGLFGLLLLIRRRR